MTYAYFVTTWPVPPQWGMTEQPDPGDQIPDVENDPVPEEPEPEGEPE